MKPTDFVSEKAPEPTDAKITEVLKVFSKVYKKPEKKTEESSEEASSEEDEGPSEPAPEYQYDQGASSDEYNEAPTNYEYSESGEESEEEEEEEDDVKKDEILKLDDYPPSVREGVLKAVIREMGYDPSALVPVNERYDDSEEQKKEYNRPLLSSYKRKNNKNQQKEQEQDDEGSDSDSEEGPNTEEIEDDLSHLPDELREKYEAAQLSQSQKQIGDEGELDDEADDIVYSDKGGKKKKKKKKGKGKKKGGGGWRPHHHGHGGHHGPSHHHKYSKGWKKSHDGILEQIVRGSAWERILHYYHQKNDEHQAKGGWGWPTGIHLETDSKVYGQKITDSMKGTIWDKMIHTYGDWRKKNMHGGTHELAGEFTIKKGHQHHHGHGGHYSRH